MISDFGCDISAKSDPHPFTVCQSTDHVVPCIPEYPDLIIGQHLNALFKVSFFHIANDVQHLFQGIQDGIANKDVQPQDKPGKNGAQHDGENEDLPAQVRRRDVTPLQFPHHE